MKVEKRSEELRNRNLLKPKPYRNAMSLGKVFYFFCEEFVWKVNLPDSEQRPMSWSDKSSEPIKKSPWCAPTEPPKPARQLNSIPALVLSRPSLQGDIPCVEVICWNTRPSRFRRFPSGYWMGSRSPRHPLCVRSGSVHSRFAPHRC